MSSRFCPSRAKQLALVNATKLGMTARMGRRAEDSMMAETRSQRLEAGNITNSLLIEIVALQS